MTFPINNRPPLTEITEGLVPVEWDRIEAVVFDMGGVFLIRHDEPVRNGMGRGGFSMPDPIGTIYHDAHYKAVRALTDAMSEGLWDETTREFWSVFERNYLLELGVPATDHDRAVDVMFREVFGKEPKPIWRQLLPDNVDAFHRLGTTGMPLAIVSNNDGTAQSQLIDFGICQVGPGPLTEVAIVVDSGIEKISKPDPRIFAPALAALGTEAANTLYVGDTVHADVLGASRAGMPVVQLDPLDLHAHLPHTRTRNVAEIVNLLQR